MPQLDRRKSPRYYCRLSALLENKEVPVYLYDLCLDGCFIETLKEDLIPKGEKVNLVIFVPCVGPIEVKGIVRHHGTPERVGMGIEFVEFSEHLQLVYALFVKKVLPLLQEARMLYQKLVKEEE